MFQAPAALPQTSPPILTTNHASQWTQAFNLWLNSLSSPHTRRSYSFAWSAFQSFSGKLPWEVTRIDIALWLDSQRSSGLSANTINQRLAALSSFFTFASQISMIRSPGSSERPLSFSNPVKSIPRLKTRSYSKSRYLTIPEARALLRAIPRHSIQGLRDYALFLTYLITGRRNSEVRTLRYCDFEIESSFLSGGRSPQSKDNSVGQVFYRWSGKGKTRRDQCPLPVWESIKDYLTASCNIPGILPDAYIFTPLTDRAARLPNVDPDSWTRNRPLSSREVGRLLKRYARRAGLDPTKIRVHTLRHTAAMLRKQAGDDVDQISSFLGHSSLSTTQVYLHHLEGQSDTSWARVAALLGIETNKLPERTPGNTRGKSKERALLGLVSLSPYGEKPVPHKEREVSDEG